MMRFEHTAWLWGLVLVPVLILVFYGLKRWKKKALKALGDEPTLRHVMPEVSAARAGWKFVLFLGVYIALVLGLANPQVGTVIEEGKRNGADLMILLDVSNSMMAGDLAPSRLENAKRAISQMIDKLHNDRIGIIIFAGEAYVQLPVTTDYSAAKLFLNNINTSIVPTQGTAIGAAINMAMKSFDLVNGGSKAIILMTDGENHEDDAVSAAKNAYSKDVTIHVIGLGSPEGAPVPIFQQGNPVGFMKDEKNQTVVSKLSEDMCKEIAGAGRGVYVRASNANSGMDIVLDQVNKMQKKTYDSKNFKDYEDRFQLCLAAALVLLLLEFFISTRKKVRLRAFNLFD
ncbi:Ca-activated chloride channel family protein [bacterium A37T11]|nr:Ca-activated chloride channel family protein [bacterium A37T11]